MFCIVDIMEEEKHFKCIICKIKKPVSQFHRKPNIRYHYHICKICNVERHIQELVIIHKIAHNQNKTFDEVLKGLHSDPLSNDYDTVLSQYVPLCSIINNDNIKEEGVLLYKILYEMLESMNKQFTLNRN